mgnify:CR=1 FL=1
MMQLLPGVGDQIAVGVTKWAGNYANIAKDSLYLPDSLLGNVNSTYISNKYCSVNTSGGEANFNLLVQILTLFIDFY